MALTLSGDDGVSGVNGSAGTPAIQGTDTNTGISFGTDTVNLVTGGSTRATMDASGEFGIGTTTPDAALHVYKAGDGQTPVHFETGNSSGDLYFYNDSDGFSIDSGGDLRFVTGRTASGTPTRMMIDANGRVRINRASGLYTEQLLVESNTQTVVPMTVSNTDTDNSAEYSIIFRRDTSLVGSIQTTLSATNYVTTSDHRLKENVAPLTGAVDRVNQLQVHRFNFIVDPDTTVDGFLAHEAQTVVPEAVTGTHNEVEVWKEGEELPDGVSVGDNKLDEDGNTIPVYQGIDQSKLVPLLTAALQEALAKIETLETRLTALEGGAS